MKHILMIIAMMFAMTSVMAATKDDADNMYKQEKYIEAAKAYEALLKEGEAASVYYNLGNCYYKTNDIPRAILNYERALTLSPGDDDVRSNLALARGKTIDKVTPAAEMFFVTWWKNMVNIMSVTAWAYLAVASFLLVLIGLLAYMFMSQLAVRKCGVYGAMAALVVCIIANIAANSQNNRIEAHTGAIVMDPVVTVKSSPSTTSTDLFIIHEGSRVEILDRSMEGWLEVRFEEGKQGWLPTGSVEVI